MMLFFRCLTFERYIVNVKLFHDDDKNKKLLHKGKAKIMDETGMYNKAITNLSTARRSIKGALELWNAAVADRIRKQIKIKYMELEIDDHEVEMMVEVEKKIFRAGLDDVKFIDHLDSLHEDSVRVAIQQLEYERDNPVNADMPAKSDKAEEEPVGKFFGELFTFVTRSLYFSLEENSLAATRERGDIDKVIRATLGISVLDLEASGILGGEKSYLRTIIPTWSDGAGLLGGENSFFRKNLGISW